MSQRAQADSLFSALIRQRDGWCQRCGTTSWLQAAHVVPRDRRATAYDPRNAMALCGWCHEWQHAHPREGQEFFEHVLGSSVYDELRRTALRGGRPDYANLIPELRRQLEEAA